MDSIDFDILISICKFLNFKDIINFSHTCKNIYHSLLIFIAKNKCFKVDEIHDMNKHFIKKLNLVTVKN